MNGILKNSYSKVLKELGYYAVNVDNIDWYEYQGFMMPAYLPHCVPVISKQTALKVVEKSGRPFVRWSTKFGQIDESQWWYVLRRKPWDIQEASRNTRSKIRRGMKKNVTRVVTLSEIREYGYKIYLCAEQRYGRKGFVVSEDEFEKKIS
ncbi:MAG: hypothetical protein PHF37_04715 [Phycisphaerae bacterium]|nr:hypothetical protein [Phycisphaerae bacterium]